MTKPENFECRLCFGSCTFAFSKTILSSQSISYFRCEECQSLQTSKPTWLEIAYSEGRTNFDTGAVQRTLWNFTGVMISAKINGLKRVLDFGGGHALLSRLIRDYGLEAYSEDAYTRATFIEGIPKAPDWSPQLVTAFEVFEHFDNPAEQISELFQNKPDWLMVSTQLYSGQGDDWWYLSVENGQHVFFYSIQAMEYIGKSFGYNFFTAGNYCFFTKNAAKLKRITLSIALNKYLLHILRSILLLLPPKGPDEDLRLLKNSDQVQADGT